MNILIFGDSITQGFHDTKMGGWVNRLAIHLMDKEVEGDQYGDYSVFNLGIFGDNSADLIKRLPTELATRMDKDGGLVIIAIGTNDSYFSVETRESKISLDEFEKNLRSCVDLAKEKSAKVCLVSPIPVIDKMLQPIPWKTTHCYSNERLDEYKEIVKKVATKTGCLLIETQDVFNPNPEDYLPDGVHPNAEGHRLVFERVLKELEKEGIIPS